MLSTVPLRKENRLMPYGEDKRWHLWRSYERTGDKRRGNQASVACRDAETSSGRRAAGAVPQAPPAQPDPSPARDIDVTDSDDEEAAGAACPSDDGFSDIGQPGDTEAPPPSTLDQ